MERGIIYRTFFFLKKKRPQHVGNGQPKQGKKDGNAEK